MHENRGLLTRLIKQEQIFVVLGIILLTVLTWSYIFYLNSAAAMPMNEISMPQMNSWNLNDFLAIFIMWSVMMTAMMIPSAAPMILVFASVYHKRKLSGNDFVPTWIFLLGYLLIWTGFSFLAAFLQWLLHHYSIISPELKLISPVSSGIVLLAVGIYQFTPMKNVCLKNCQNPLNFVMGSWREGSLGAFIMGIHHGLYCLGCCWILMLLLFVAGVMNLIWVAMIAVLIFLEKIIPSGKWFIRISGILFAAWGFILIIKS